MQNVKEHRIASGIAKTRRTRREYWQTYYQGERAEKHRRTSATYWRELSAERRWEINIKQAYGMTARDYYVMFVDQKQACAICKAKPDAKLLVDHCHRTGMVRGLLCHSCNTLVGHLEKKTPKVVADALRYIAASVMAEVVAYADIS